MNEKDRLAVIILAALLAHALDTLQKVVKIKVHVRIYYSVIFMLGTLSTIHEEVGCLPVSIPGI